MDKNPTITVRTKPFRPDDEVVELALAMHSKSYLNLMEVPTSQF